MEGLFPSLKDGNLCQVTIQMGLYGYVLFIAADMIGDGAEMLLLVPKYAGLVGSIVLPILGAVPDGMMVLCSGLGSPDEAQKEVAVGVGALAGSTIMLLTLPWFLSIWCGRVNIDNSGTFPPPAYSSAIKLDPEMPLLRSLSSTGVGIGKPLKKNAKMMLGTATTYLIIQGPAFKVDSQAAYKEMSPHEQVEERIYESGFENVFAWAGLAASTLWFFIYLYLSYVESTQERGQVQEQIQRVTYAEIQKGTLTLRGAMADFRNTTFDAVKDGNLEEGLLNTSETTDSQVRHLSRLLVPFFGQYDENGDNKINFDEFKNIMRDLGERPNLADERKLFESADADKSGSIEFEEFVVCMMAFALSPDKGKSLENTGPPKRIPTAGAYIQDMRTEDEEEGDPAEQEDMPEDLRSLSPEQQQAQVKKRAFSSMFWGSVLVLLFSDPMCDCLGLFADKIEVPKFYVSFLLAPLASNASELVSAMKLAQKRTLSSMVQSLSTLEGAAIMNNTFCLGIFLVLIVWKGLAWQFSAETISIIAIQVVIGVIVLLKDTEKLFDGVLILLLYPLALLIVYVLENKMGLD